VQIGQPGVGDEDNPEGLHQEEPARDAHQLGEEDHAVARPPLHRAALVGLPERVQTLHGHGLLLRRRTLLAHQEEQAAGRTPRQVLGRPGRHDPRLPPQERGALPRPQTRKRAARLGRLVQDHRLRPLQVQYQGNVGHQLLLRHARVVLPRNHPAPGPRQTGRPLVAGLPHLRDDGRHAPLRTQE